MTEFIRRAPTTHRPSPNFTIGQKDQNPRSTPSVNSNKGTWVSPQGPRWKVGTKDNQGSSPPLAAHKQNSQAQIPMGSPKLAEVPTQPKALAERDIQTSGTKKSPLKDAKNFFHKLGDKAHINKALSKAGYKQNEILSIGTVKPNNLQGDLKALSSGQLNTAYTAHFKQADGTTKELVVKFEAKYTSQKDMPDFLRSLGIDPKNSKETARNLAAKTLDNLLGWNNIVHTEVGVLKDPNSGQYKVVTAMEKAEGISGYGHHLGHKEIDAERLKRYKFLKKELAGNPEDLLSTLNGLLGIKHLSELEEMKDEKGRTVGVKVPSYGHKISPQDTKLKEELVKLQLQDTIMSQGDRHIGNYFIQTEPGRPNGKEKVVGIKGIDNDQLGGTATTIQVYSTLKELPPEIPSSVCKDIINLNPQDFQRQMECCLPKAEAEAATARLKLVQEHAQKVLDNNIKNGEGSLLPGSQYDYNNSYYMNFLAAHFSDEAKRIANAT